MGSQARPRGLRVRFAYASVDEFVTTYAYYCEDDALFAPTDKVIPPETEVAFSLELSDSTPMLRGMGVVLECWETDDNRFGRRGVFIGFSKLTTSTEPIHARMLALHRLEDEETTDVTQVPPSRTRNAPDTVQQFGRRRTAQIEAPHVEETDDGEMKRSITREMAAVADPSIPITIEDDKANATSRYEGLLRGPAFPAKPRAQSPLPSAIAPRAQSPMPGVVAAATTTPASSPVPLATTLVKTAPLSGASPGPLVPPLSGVMPTTLAGATSPLTRSPAPIPATSAKGTPSSPVPVSRTPIDESPPVASRTPTGQSSPAVSRASTGPALPLVAPPASSTPIAAPRTSTGQSLPLAAVPASSSDIADVPLPPTLPDATPTTSVSAASNPSFGVTPETAETRPEGRNAVQPPPLPPIPAATPSTRPANLARGSSPAPLAEQLAESATTIERPASSGAQSAAPSVVPMEGTEPVVTDDDWRHSAHETPKRWRPTRRGVLTFASGILAGLLVSLVVRAKPTAPAAAPPPQPTALSAPPIAQCKESPKSDTSVAALEGSSGPSSPETANTAASSIATENSATAASSIATAAPTNNATTATTAVTTKTPTAVTTKTPSAPTKKTPAAPTTKTPPATIAKAPTSAPTTASSQPPATKAAPATVKATTSAKTPTTAKSATVAKTPTKSATKTAKAPKAACTSLDCI